MPDFPNIRPRKAQRSTTRDDHVRLGGQYQIAVLQHQFIMMD